MCPNFTYKKWLMEWCHDKLTKTFWQITSPFYFLDFNRPSSSLAGHYQYMGNDNAPDYANLTSISRRGAGYYNTQCGTISFISDFFRLKLVYSGKIVLRIAFYQHKKKSLSWVFCSKLVKWKKKWILICSINLQVIFYILLFFSNLAIWESDN